MLQLAQNIQQLHKERRSFVLVTLVALKGSAPQIEGAKLIVTADGYYWGTVGGGKIEARCIEYSRELLGDVKNKKSHVKHWNLQKDIGMSCGGEVSVFFDINETNGWHVSIFGAGHVSQELCRVLSTWSCQISVFDPRTEWLEKLPVAMNIEKKYAAEMPTEVANLPTGSYFLSVTQGHGFDVPILNAAFKRFDDFAFVGVIGSDVKAKRLKAELLALGCKPDQLDRLVCPLGLPIGNNTPSEIAVSIAAQLLAVRDHISFRVTKGYYD